MWILDFVVYIPFTESKRYRCSSNVPRTFEFVRKYAALLLSIFDFNDTHTVYDVLFKELPGKISPVFSSNIIQIIEY